MNDADVKAVLTEALADHALDSDYCSCGWRMSPDFGTREDWAAHVADAILALSGVAVIQLPEGALTEETETIPVFVEDVPRIMVARGLEEVPARHAEFIPHRRLKTVWHSDECPECAVERGVHDRRRAEYRAAAVLSGEASGE